MLAEAGLVYLHEPHLSDRGGGLKLVHGGRAARPSEALHALGDCAARNDNNLLARLAQARDLARPARNRGRVESRAAIGNERAADLDDETLCPAHAVLLVSRNFITDCASSRQPSLVSAEMRKLGPRKRSLRTTFSTTASCSSPGSISILLNTSQRGFRWSAGSNFFSSAMIERASRAGSAPLSIGAMSTMCRSSRVRARCLRN